MYFFCGSDSEESRHAKLLKAKIMRNDKKKLKELRQSIEILISKKLFIFKLNWSFYCGWECECFNLNF